MPILLVGPHSPLYRSISQAMSAAGPGDTIQLESGYSNETASVTHSGMTVNGDASSTGIEGRINRWQDIEYHAPCLYLLHSRIAPAGVLPPENGPDDQAFHVEVVYAITPSTEHETYDFWMVARDFALGDEKVSEFVATNNRTVVLQDVVALDLLEKVVESEKDNYQELSINIDTGGLAARRILKKQIAAGEAAAAEPVAETV